jgi:type I restriction enzyme S subunit
MVRNLNESSIPSDWRYDYLDKFAQRGSGHTPDKEIPEYWNAGIKWISLADSSKLDNGYIYETDKEISEAGIKNSSAVLHPKETVVLSRDAGVGKSAVMFEPMAVSQHFIAWRCDNSQKLNSWFLYNWLQLMKPEFERQAVGSTIKTIGLPFFKKLKIAAPPLPEQQKIARILSTWDKAIEKLEALIAAKQKRKKALMQQLLTGKKRFSGFEWEWKEAKLKNLCAIVTGKKDVNEGNVNGKFPFFTCAKEPTYSDSYSFNKEAILISGNGVGVGYSHYINGKFEVYQRTYVLSEFRSNINVQYLLVWIKKYLRREILREKQDGAMPYIKLGLLQSFKLFLPSIEEQQKIATVLTTADTEIQTHQNQLSALKEQKKGLMQQLLTGKKRVKVEAHV